MNIFDLSTVICTSSVEVAKKDVCPLDVEVFIKDNYDCAYKVNNADLLYSEDSNKFVLVLSNIDD